ncbi:MAG: 2-C-methyl-D-erythritol 2,4-cyclodiphosphate synthase [Desulfobacterales bacterium]|nr:2-C-methyl-D-erythritol 2,4-cyclodiphosphate synthase [Desulfobacterales bacterium]TET53256.1 MAG: 2-C-methyl-D-erythritol 2,4-cyclodiphosphate synthase [Desulfobacteraceae bacterium]
MVKERFRVGFGYDVHRLVEGKPLILGGVTIPNDKGLFGYSDADVLIHAVIDAILGALGKGDIGQHFPDSDPAYQGADSLTLLKKIVGLAHDKGLTVNNLDATIVAQKPKLSPYLNDMKERLSTVLQVDPDVLNVKATTTEGLGFCGREEGIAAYAVVSLGRK